MVHSLLDYCRISFVVIVQCLSFVSAKTSFCLSCLTEPPTYAKANISSVASYLETKQIIVPRIAINCRETPNSMQPDFKDVYALQCLSGACVKLKGYIEGESFVVRGCWDKLWSRKLVDGWAGCTHVEFMTETETDICICYGDLCNNASCESYSFLLCFSSLLMLMIFHRSFL